MAGDTTRMQDLTELIIVCCHAIFTGSDIYDESHWSLVSFQHSNASIGKPGDHQTFIAHILAAAVAAESRPQAMLMFSGGRTTKHELSEAESYDNALLGLGPQYDKLHKHSAREELATDSYQNLLFSIIKFRELTGRYPRFVTVVTHAFKQRRFLDLHAPAIKWPSSRIRVHGINPPMTTQELEEVTEAESERASKLFVQDLYGTRSPLADKRTTRNWDASSLAKLAEVDGEDAELAKLLQWNGGEDGKQIFPGSLPWSEAETPIG